MQSREIKIYISDGTDPYVNLAAETVLLERGDLCLYQWRNERTVVIGRHQNPYTECNVAALNADGGRLARRLTGGGAVYHDKGNLNFSFIVPATDYDVARQLQVIVTALRHFGIMAVATGRNDLTVDGKKFSGNAFLLGRETKLHHGTILIDTEGDALTRYLLVKGSKPERRGVQSVASTVVNLRELNPSITADELIPQLILSAEKMLETTAKNGDFAELRSSDRVKTLAKTYSSNEFLFGKWKDFSAEKRGSFTWGSAEISMSNGRISAISTDGMYPEAVTAAMELFNEKTPLPHLSDEARAAVYDIIKLAKE